MQRTTPIKIVIAGGGTGGHVLPAISVIEELKRRAVPVELLWIGSHGGVEQKRAEQAGARFVAVKTGKFRRYLDVRTAPDLVRVPVGTVQAWRHLRAFRPDVIFSTGGFVSVPTVAAGSRLAPVLTHEQTTIVGLATRINGLFANTIALSYEQTRALVKGTKSRIVCTGNPVRLSLLEGDAARGRARIGISEDLPVVYVTGGAQGAHKINVAIESLLPWLLERANVIHQCGAPNEFDDPSRLRTFRERLDPDQQSRYHIVEFIGDEIADIYAMASVVIGRAGAGTVAELALLGKPSILVPLPLSGGGEQVVNAKLLADAGAAVVVPQSETLASDLRLALEDLLGDISRLSTMSARAQELGRPEAASKLVDELLLLIKA